MFSNSFFSFDDSAVSTNSSSANWQRIWKRCSEPSAAIPYTVSDSPIDRTDDEDDEDKEEDDDEDIESNPIPIEPEDPSDEDPPKQGTDTPPSDDITDVIPEVPNTSTES